MNLINLDDLSRRESERVEWKENVADIDDVAADLCAFANDLANMGGGYVVCGARETKDEHGFPKVEMIGLAADRMHEVEAKTLAICRDRVDPAIQPTVEHLETSDPARRVLVFLIAASQRAHSFRRRGENSPTYYIRNSRETIAARNGLYMELLQRKQVVEPWDKRVCAGATEGDLDLVDLADFINRTGVYDPARPLHDYMTEDGAIGAGVPAMLVKDGMAGILRPRNYAVLLFGRDPQRWVPGAYCIYSRYPGADRASENAIRAEYRGSLYRQVLRLLQDIEAEAPLLIDKSQQVANRFRYPVRALREAVVNAFVHRDYEDGDPIQINSYSDRLEIFSPGGLVSKVQQEDFVRGRAFARWRNQALSEYFLRLGVAQRVGQGITTIIRTMRESGNPEPRFEARPDHVVSVLPALRGHGASVD